MSTFKKAGIGLLVGLAIFGLAEVLTNFSLLVTLVFGVLAGGIAVIILIALSRGEDPKDVAQEVVEAAVETVTESPTVAEERRAHNALLSSATDFIISGSAAEVKEELQVLVGELRQVVPRALQFSPTSETTFNVLKLCHTDLPDHLKHFREMSVTDQDRYRAQFSGQLSELAEKVKRIADAIDLGRSADFEAQSAFVDLKFN